MFNLIGEVSERAHWDALLRWVLRVTVTLSLVWDDHLRVGFSAESARLKEWLGVPDTSGVHIQSSLNVIHCINDKVKVLPELVIEYIFSLRCYK